MIVFVAMPLVVIGLNQVAIIYYLHNQKMLHGHCLGSSSFLLIRELWSLRLICMEARGLRLSRAEFATCLNN